LQVVEAPLSRLGEFAWSNKLHYKLDFVCYLLWLRSARSVALQLQQQQPFAAVVHAAYGCYWLPSPIVDLDAPSVWGPVGGATTSPWRLWYFLGWRGICGEMTTFITIRLASRLPATRRTWRRATLRLAETENTRCSFPPALRKDTRVINRAMLQTAPPQPPSARASYLIFPSRLHPKKGARLALHALAYTPPWVRLIFAADGPERRVLERLARRLAIAERVEFRGWLPRAEMLQMLAQAAAAVFTGLREEGGCALAEAMQLGTPVIVLGIGGARQIAEANTDPSRVAIIEPSNPHDTAQAMGAAMTRFAAKPSPSTSSYLNRAATEQALLGALTDALASPIYEKSRTRHQGR
jgi:glycosyltransferase involved in cell wall biosynthesis